MRNFKFSGMLIKEGQRKRGKKENWMRYFFRKRTSFSLFIKISCEFASNGKNFVHANKCTWKSINCVLVILGQDRKWEREREGGKTESTNVVNGWCVRRKYIGMKHVHLPSKACKDQCIACELMQLSTDAEKNCSVQKVSLINPTSSNKHCEKKFFIWIFYTAFFDIKKSFVSFGISLAAWVKNFDHNREYGF